MIRSLIARGAAALALLSLVSAPALAQTNPTASTITVKDGTGAAQTIATGTGTVVTTKQGYAMYGASATGSSVYPLADAYTLDLVRQYTLALSQTVGPVGSPAANAQTVQAPAGGFPVTIGTGGLGGNISNPLYVAQSQRYPDATLVAQSPTVTANSAYTSGNVVGGLLTFAGMSRNASGNGTLQDIVVQFKSQQTQPVDLLLFGANPTSTTVTDKAALSLATADVAKLIATIHVSACTSYGTPSACEQHNQGVKFTADASTNLYGILVTRGTPTYASTSDVTVQLGAERNF